MDNYPINAKRYAHNPLLPPECQSYFDSLPKMVQESIMQNGMRFDSREQLTAFVDNFTGYSVDL